MDLDPRHGDLRLWLNYLGLEFKIKHIYLGENTQKTLNFSPKSLLFASSLDYDFCTVSNCLFFSRRKDRHSEENPFLDMNKLKMYPFPTLPTSENCIDRETSTQEKELNRKYDIHHTKPFRLSIRIQPVRSLPLHRLPSRLLRDADERTSTCCVAP